MGILDGALREMKSTSEKRSMTANTSLFNDVISLFGGTTTGKITTSNYKPSLKLSAVYDAVNQISDSLAVIPFSVYQKVESSRIRITAHPGDKLLYGSPNNYMTPFIWKKTMQVSKLLRGNGLSIIKFNAKGEPVELEFVNWDFVYDIRYKDGELLYFITGYDRPYLSSEVIHIKNLSHNGIVGISPITYAAQQLNIALEIQNFSATNFEAKGVRQGVIESDKAIPNGKPAIINGWRNAMAERSADRVAVLDEGMKYKSISITPQEAQIVEMSRFSIEDIARWFNIPPHKIKSLAQSTNNNIEQQSLDYASDTIMPHVVNDEQEFATKLLTSTEKMNNFFVKGNMNVILRSDIKARAEYYSKAVNFGWLNRNEVRGLEDMNAGPTLLDEYLTPVNAFTEDQLKNNTNSNPGANG